MKTFARHTAAPALVACLCLLALSCEVNQRFTVSYDGNNETSGLAPVDGASYRTGAIVTVLGQNTLARSGYTFIGWNTAADGSGTARAPDDEFSMIAANVVLYAQWEAIPTYGVIYRANGATDGNAPSDGLAFMTGETVTVLGQGSLSWTGYRFTGWNTAADGSGTAYSPDDEFAMGAADVQLYAQWTPHRIVTYAPNGATSGNPPADATVYDVDADVTVLGAGTLVRDDFLFDGWNTAADGSGTDYAAGSILKMGGIGVVLYAQWWQPAVHFDTGAGAPAFPDARATRLATIPAAAWDGHALEGWYPNGSFNAIEKISFPLDIAADRTLYAHWIDATGGLAYAPVTGGYAVAKGTSVNAAGAITIPAFWLGDPVVAVAESGFRDHNLITGIVIPSSVTSIGANAFSACSSLLTAALPAGLTTLGGYAFAYCPILNDITVPNGITILGSWTFYACRGLTNIELPDSMTAINDRALSCTGLVAIDLPTSLGTIGYAAFWDCNSLTTLDIPASVTYIDDWAFRDCDVLATIHARRTAPPQVRIGSYPMFHLCPVLTKIYVPVGFEGAYTGAAGWSNYTALIDEEP